MHAYELNQTGVIPIFLQIIIIIKYCAHVIHLQPSEHSAPERFSVSVNLIQRSPTPTVILFPSH